MKTKKTYVLKDDESETTAIFERTIHQMVAELANLYMLL